MGKAKRKVRDGGKENGIFPDRDIFPIDAGEKRGTKRTIKPRGIPLALHGRESDGIEEIDGWRRLLLFNSFHLSFRTLCGTIDQFCLVQCDRLVSTVLRGWVEYYILRGFFLFSFSFFNIISWHSLGYTNASFLFVQLLANIRIVKC